MRPNELSLQRHKNRRWRRFSPPSDGSSPTTTPPRPPPKAVDPLPPPPHAAGERPEPVPPPPRAAPVVPPRPAPEPAMRQAEIDAMLSEPQRGALRRRRSRTAPPAPDILELTESMAAEDPQPPSDGFRTIDGQSDVVFDERPVPEPEPDRAGRRAARRCCERATAAGLGSDDRRRSIPRSIRSPRPCWCRTPARSRIWCARCCARCSRPGSTTICRGWSSGWCAPRSSACRAGGLELAARVRARARTTAPSARQHDGRQHDQTAAPRRHGRTRSRPRRRRRSARHRWRRRTARSRWRALPASSACRRSAACCGARRSRGRRGRPRAVRATRPARSPAPDSRRRTSIAPPTASPR